MKGCFWEESSSILQGLSNKPAFKSCQPGCCYSTSLFFKILILKLDLETDSIHLSSTPMELIFPPIPHTLPFKGVKLCLIKEKNLNLSNDQSTTVFLIRSYLIMCGILKKPRYLKVAVSEVKKHWSRRKSFR